MSAADVAGALLRGGVLADPAIRSTDRELI
jgi:hypothetical protein